MSNDYAREVLRRTVAQTCQTIGWQGINSTPLDILVHVLEKYILTLGTQAHRIAEHCNRTEPNLDDLGLVFQALHVRLPELREYTRCVPPAPCPLNVPSFPLPKEAHLNFLKPGSQEVVTRPVHVHEYLPAMYPDKEKESTPPVADTVEITHNGTEELEQEPGEACRSPHVSATDIPDRPRDVFKRPTDPVSTSSIKKARLKLEEEDCHTREISSVMMTMSGFLSPAREGKLPEAKTPHIVPDVVHQEKVKTTHLNPLAHLNNPLVNRIEKKLKKNKLANGKMEKVSKRKEKSHKNPLAKQKNSENKVNKLAMRLAENRHNKLAMHLARGKVRPSGSSKHQPREPHLQQPPPSPSKTTKPFKQEMHFKNSREVASTFDPRPPSIPKVHKHPLVPHHIPNSTPEQVLPPNVVIKEERVEAEKLTSQPDRSKLNIFKKISPKVKEERHDPHEKYSHDNGALKFEKGPSHLAPGLMIEESDSHRRKAFPANDFRDHGALASNAMDLSSRPAPNANEVINIDDDSNDGRRHFIKSEPLEESPRVLSKPKPSSSIKMSSVPIMKEKKERKHKGRKPKPDKAIKEFSKMLKETKMQMMKDASRLSAFPMIPPGLVPGPAMIPTPSLIPGGGLFSRLNPALKGMLPNDNFLPNPFCMDPSRPGLLPAGPGLIPPGPLLTHLAHGFGQPPRMTQHPNLPPFLRRPSLEVIPLDEMDDPRPPPNTAFSFVPPPLTIKEKDKHDKHKSSPKENFVLNSGISVTTSPTKQSSPKTNPILQMPPIKPDITIKLNPPDKQRIPEHKIEPVVIDEPSLVIETKEKEKDKSERKKDKLHKKDRKDKDQKIKKKKDKKDKLKLKLEKKKEKEERHDSKEKLKKEKKEKRKDKEKTPVAIATPIPKLTLKLGPSSPMLPPSPDNPRRLTIKPVVNKDDAIVTITEKLDDSNELSVERSQSPELARISALVTRPPKVKLPGKHHPPGKTDVAPDLNTSASPPQTTNSSPTRKNRPPSSFSKYKRIYFKPIPKRSGFDDSITDPDVEEGTPEEVVNIVDNIPNVPLGTPFYMDPHGNKVWICPACGRPDNGSPMIGCDGCDGWYHWICVGIRIAPDDSEDWYCTSCHAKRAAMASAMAGGGGGGLHTAKKRGRKPKADKLKDN